MNDFNPGEGWREMPRGTYAEDGDDSTLVLIVKGQKTRRWVREEPVPPLPTESWTSIEVTTTSGKTEVWYLNGRDRMWWQVEVESGDLTPFELMQRITGFELLARPFTPGLGDQLRESVRRETANAVLDRAWQWYISETKGKGDREAFEDLYGEFGVEVSS